MLIDDVKGALAALKTEMQEDRRIKSGADLNVGDIVYQNMDRSDGLVLNKGYDDRLKYFVIVGKNSKGDAIGLCLRARNQTNYRRIRNSMYHKSLNQFGIINVSASGAMVISIGK